jgi:hypothetical protein
VSRPWDGGHREFAPPFCSASGNVGRCKHDQAQHTNTIFLPRFRAQDAKPLLPARLIFLIRTWGAETPPSFDSDIALFSFFLQASGFYQHRFLLLYYKGTLQRASAWRTRGRKGLRWGQGPATGRHQSVWLLCLRLWPAATPLGPQKIFQGYGAKWPPCTPGAG